MASSLPVLPPNFKPIQHYLKTAQEHDSRDPVVSYYCRLYALQKAMEIDKKSPDCRAFLLHMMDQLEQVKKANAENEAIQNEVVGQAHVENYALKVFLYADNEDRAARFGKNVVKSFYTAGMLFDVLTNFGELSEDIEDNRKYARWKAAYIHNCLKRGETPVAGPMPDSDIQPGATGGDIGFGGAAQPPPQQPGPSSSDPGSLNPAGHMQPPNMGTHAPPTTPQEPPRAAMAPPTQPSAQQQWQPPANQGAAASLKPEDYQRAMKLCKYANSALQYEDSKTAIDNLTKALKLLTTGHE